jgi:hypothetical protein
MASDSRDTKSATEHVRTTLLLPATLDRNLEFLAVTTGSSKSDIVKKALFDYLAKSGLEPSKTPTLTVSYGSEV